jgi:hypothetical protein
VTRALAAVVATVCATQPLPLVAQRPAGTIYERPIVTAGAGPQRLAVDAGLLAGGAPFRVERRGERAYAVDGLADLRLASEDGRLVPYLLIAPPSPERTWVPGAVLPVAPTKKASGFDVDLGLPQDVDTIRIDGLPAPHLKRLALEGSGDREHWTMLVAEGTVFDLPDEELRQNTLGFTPGTYRYFRVTWNDTNSGRVPSPRAVSARRVATASPPPAATVSTSFERRPSEPGVSRYQVRLSAARLPFVALELDIGTAVGGGHVFRRAVVSESRFSDVEAAPVELGRAMLARIVRDGATASALRVPIATPTEAELELTIEDGANEPLELKAVTGILAELPWIYFEAPAGRVTARYGDRTLTKPVYDLEAARDTVNLAKVPEARWTDGATTRTVAAAGTAAILPPEAGPALDASAFTYTRAVVTASGDQPATALVALPLDAHALAYSRGASARFADARILDGSNRQIPYLVERRNEPLSLDLPIVPAPDAQAQALKMPAGSRQRSVYLLKLPHPNLPPSVLVLETSGTIFRRTISVGVERKPNRQSRDAFFEERSSGTWGHADEQTAARPLQLRLGAMPETDLLLVVDEGDNAPLPLTAARLLLPSYRLRFFRAGSEPVRLAYGRDDLQPPRYDLALLAPRVMGAVATEVGLAAAAGPASATAENRAGVSTIFWVAMGVSVLVLLGIIVRLLRVH